MKTGRLTAILAVLTVAALALASPRALRTALERGEFYVFTQEFLTDIPRRLAGPGRFRFILQPALAILIGIRGGIADRRAGRPNYLRALVGTGEQRRKAMVHGFGVIVNLLLMGILLDAVFQRVILGAAYPGAALVVGPVLIATPYLLARSVAHGVAPRVRPD